MRMKSVSALCEEVGVVEMVRQVVRAKVNHVHVRKTYKASIGAGLLTPKLGNRWRWLVSFTPRLLYPQANNPYTH